ncbi:MAG: S-layer homology domain-containing protein [Pyramidobacter sp.]
MSMKKMLAVVAAASLVAVAAPAFAANPFSDVPMNHWAYDAVEELASKGILEGYPNGTFKGNRAMTRYEIATMVARMMNAGLTGADLEKLKALVVEFQPELDALGVKVDGFDSRLTALEKGVGGWKITGEFRFDYNAFDKEAVPFGKYKEATETDPATLNDLPNGDGFKNSRYRLFLHKDLTDGITFDARYHGGKFDWAYVTAKDFLGMEDLTFRAGQWEIDWEGDDGLYYDNDSFFMDQTFQGVDLKYSRGMFTVEGLVATGMDRDDVYGASSDEYYGARLRADFSEKLWMSLNGLWVNHEDWNAKIYWAGLGFKFMDGLELKGAYYMEDLAKDSTIAQTTADTGLKVADVDDPKAWKVILDVNQDVLKFTSLWFEYAQFDEGFILQNTPYAFNDGMFVAPGVKSGYGANPIIDDMDAFFIGAKQKWNDKWNTFERYAKYDMDNVGDAKEWTVGVKYQYSPNLYFELAYNDISVSEDAALGNFKYDDNQVRFRTYLSF